MSFPINYGLFKLNLSDHYAVLGVSLDADGKQIRQKYLKIAQKLHPDTCKASNETVKHKAGQIFSKLVNPAYEKLSKEENRKEYQVILSETGKRLAGDSSGYVLSLLTHTLAKNLWQATDNNLELLYQKSLQTLSAELYQSFDLVDEKIGQISELNLVYLVKKQLKSTFVAAQPEVKTTPITNQTTTTKIEPSVNNKNQTDEEQLRQSQLASYLRRAQGYLDSSNLVQAMLELRDAIKLDPNSSKAHALIGLTYLKQNQTTMAKIHINKAWQLEPKDPLVIQSKQELDKLDSAKGKNNSSAETKKGNAPEQTKGGSILSSWFSGKKR